MSRLLHPGRDRGCSPLALTWRVIHSTSLRVFFLAGPVEMQLMPFDPIAEFLDGLLRNGVFIHTA